MGRIKQYVRLSAFRKGVLGTSRGWFAVWASMSLARFLKKRLGKQPVVVERIVLGPGQGVVIRDTAVEREAFPKDALRR